ncbi:FMN-dependent NADH-azoreductase [Pseudonocardia xinjiangensis]|uniref:FMN dependent NADH:quinone oxidoreductase n=1 Tax=Pseudonocardia xinjiangensis TaxID=75289 RepID=A0ABX1R9I5_9PSEU|nr:NAD(P)H-dependent oxidoreductase [Pseudonocardia xinjiangensis]NMH76105.1 flavodoxin family protein [Pseudonocardia xinjiangensis]
MTFLRVDSSIRDEESVSRELTDAVERAWLAADPDAEVVHRDLAAAPVRLETWQLATYGGFLPPDLRTRAMRDASAAACRAADEVLAADAITVGAPLYNFGVPAALKSWIDLLITDPRFDPRHTPLGRSLAGVPLSLVIARGGGYGPGSPREGWDHSTPYLERIFGDVFGAEVTLIVAELTAADIDPAMAALRPLAARSRADALARAGAVAAEHARAHGAPSTRRRRVALARAASSASGG